MAKNTDEGFRIGSVKDRSQLDVDPKGEKFIKRDTKAGEFIDRKTDDKPFEGVAREPDKRKQK